MFFENDADRLLRRFLSSANPIFGMAQPGEGFCNSGLCSEPDQNKENDVFGIDGSNPNVRYYGFVMTTGPDGRPIIHEYGNARPETRQHLPADHRPESTRGAREPLVDTIVDEKERVVKLIAEMPGVEKRDIKILADGNHVSVSANGRNGKGKRYQMRIPLERKVNEGSAKATYRNGVLQITFSLAEEPHNGRAVRID